MKHLASLCAPALLAALLSPGAMAQLGNQPIEVTNPPGERLDVALPGGVEVTNLPATQTVDGTVNVGNFPASQTVDGAVSITNLPATQTVDGTVDIGNFPATQTVDGQVTVTNLPAIQAVSGSVAISGDVPVVAADGVGHLGVPLSEHRAYRLSARPLVGLSGVVQFTDLQPTGGGRSPALGAGECLVLLDMEVGFETYEILNPGLFGNDPLAPVYIELGLTNGAGSAFSSRVTLTGFSRESSAGVITREFRGGLLLGESLAEGETVNELALRTSPRGAADEFVVVVQHAAATGYVTDCP